VNGHFEMSAIIAASLREQIDNGTLKPGDVVSILDLVSEWRTSPAPVVQAVRAIANEGRVRLCIGYGHVVQPRPGPPREKEDQRCPDCGYLFCASGHSIECIK
jgi:DNA-binding GntR family transcriptional regulator